MSEKEPVFTHHYYVRGHRGLIPHGISDASVLVGYEVAGSVPNTYPRLTEDATITQFFPSSHVSISSASWAEYLNLSTSVPNNATPLTRYGPLNPIAVGSTPYESLVVHALYNVKTWRLVGDVEGSAFDLLIPAGQSLDVDGVYTPVSRPNSGERSVYSTSAAWELYDDSDPGNIIDVSMTFSVGGERLRGSSSHPYTFVPGFSFLLASGGFVQNPSAAAGSVDPDITFLGQEVYSVPGFSGAPTSYSLTVSADELWTNADTWVSAS